MTGAIVRAMALHPKDTDTDASLLAATARGEVAAFERLHRRFHSRLFGFALRLTSRPETAEEVVGDTLMVVWRKAGDFRGEARPSTWIFGIAYRIAMKARRKLAPEALHDEVDDQIAADTTGPETIEALFERKRIAAALRQLPAEQRAAVELTYFHGYKVQEVAAIQECPVGTVKTRMFQARAKLRAILTAEAPATGGLG